MSKLLLLLLLLLLGVACGLCSKLQSVDATAAILIDGIAIPLHFCCQLCCSAALLHLHQVHCEVSTLGGGYQVGRQTVVPAQA
jgi:hypothetical protein